MDTGVGYQILKKATEDEVYCQCLMNNCDYVLREAGIVDQADVEELRKIISTFIAARLAQTEENESMRKWSSNQRETTGRTADKFKQGLRETIDQIDRSFSSTAVMYQVSFYFGLILILSSVVFAFLGKGALLPIIFAGLGSADVVTFFITNPPQQLQRSRADLAQLQLACFTWFNDYFNWNAAMNSINRMSDPDSVFECMKKFSDAQIESAGKTMDLIEKHCEFISRKSSSTARQKQSIPA